MTGLRKNVLVGITVLGALAALGWMIVQFGGTLGGFVGGGGYFVTMEAPRVDGLSEGNRVQYLGLGVGRVESIRLDDDQTGFEVVLSIRPGTRVPSNVVGVVRATNLISGGAAVDLALQGDAAEGRLLEQAGTTIPGEFGGADLVPPEIAALADEVRLIVAELRQTGLVDTLDDVATKAGTLADNLNAIAGSDELQTDLRQAVASVRQAADAAAVAADEYRQLGRNLNELQADAQAVFSDARDVAGEAKAAVTSARGTIDKAGTDLATLTTDLQARLAQADETFARVNRLLAQAEDGQGTLGLLLNDPRAYEALNDDLRLLNDVLRTADRLLEQIEQEGFKVDLF